MPFRPKHSLLNIDVDKMHTIDTRSVENLFGMWSVFSKTSEALEDGKRLENLSWRLWNRETFCCCPETQARSTNLSPQSSFPTRRKSSSIARIPELASSIDTATDYETDDDDTLPSMQSPVRPELRRIESIDSRSKGRERHITPIDLEKIVISIKEKKCLEPLSPLAIPTISEPEATTEEVDLSEKEISTTAPNPQGAPAPSTSHTTDAIQTSPTLDHHLESSASTMATSNSDESQPAPASDSSSTAISTHSYSVVRGFNPGGAPSSYRSQTQLAAQPTPILKTSPRYQSERQKGKAPMFTLGTSSGEDESSLDTHMYKNSLSSNLSSALHRPGGKKQASFKEEVNVSKAVQDSPVFDDSDDEEDDDDISEDAIEEDEDSSDWEDEGDDDKSLTDDRELFQRVDSRPNLTSRRSVLTSMLNEPDRARAFANASANSRSTPALRKPRDASPNGPSVASSPSRDHPMPPNGLQMSQAQPIIMTTSNTHQPLLSPRTTRRNMLSTELTESLRKNLLWERQHKSSQNIAALKRRHTSADVKNLKQMPEPGPILSSKENAGKFNNDYFNAGLQEYHARGW